jgi:hypothetical protein
MRILPVRVAFTGELPYDLGAYLDPIQYVLWEGDRDDALICEAVVQAIVGEGTLPLEGRDREVAPSPESIQRLADATEHAGAPLPVADPRLETGALAPSSPFYIKRAEDARIETPAHQGGETIIIKAPRQYGKSSLMARRLSLARRAHMRTCVIDFQLLDVRQLHALEELCRHLAYRISRDLRTGRKPGELWDDYLGPKECLTYFIEDVVLGEEETRLLLCFDEVDRLFDSEFRDDFFAAIRGWHNRRAIEDCWKRLDLLLVHSTEPALWIQNLTTSPFNIGERICLPPFDKDNAAELNQRHGNPLTRSQDVSKVLNLLGGQPYLMRQAFYALVTHRRTARELDNVATDDRGPFGDHLRRLLFALRRDSRCVESLRQILRNGACDDETAFERLAAAGLVRGDTRRSACMACELYERYLRRRL